MLSVGRLPKMLLHGQVVNAGQTFPGKPKIV